MQGRVNKSGLVHFLLGLVSSRATGQLIGLIAVLSIVWFAGRMVGLDTTDTVSYTHLTLPTICSV